MKEGESDMYAEKIELNKERELKMHAGKTQAKKKSEFAKYSGADKTLLVTGYILLVIFLVAIILPIIYIIVASFMDPITLQNKGITFDVEKWTLTAYERVLSNNQIWIGFKNAVVYSVIFAAISVFITLLAA